MRWVPPSDSHVNRGSGGYTSGMRVDEGAAREQLTSLKAELESQQELLLQGIDLFGSQVLVPYLFGLAEADMRQTPSLTALSRIDDAAERGRELESRPWHIEGADPGK